jgi:PhnB protein
MSNVTLIEQLDAALETLLRTPDAAVPSMDPSVDELLRVAMELRDLPAAEIKARLRAELDRRIARIKSGVKPIREGFHTVTPCLVGSEVDELIEFVKQAFGGQLVFRTPGSARIHAEVRIGDSMLMMGGGTDWQGGPFPTGLHLYVKDADEVYERALQAGASSLHAPVDQPYGDREASVKDVFGNHWYIATHKATGHMPEGLHSVTPYLHPIGAGKMIEFLERAFGGEEQYRAQSPDGVIHHATVKIGDSIVEMGEAHGPWQPMPTMFYVYHDDVDGLYRRAVRAGAVSQSAPADQPYGDRVAGVTDPFNNVWYIGTHIRD